MKIYVAAPYAAREQVVEIARLLEEHDHVCTSTWKDGSREIHVGTIGISRDTPIEEVAQHAQGDLNDVGNSDVLVQLTSNYIIRSLDLPNEWLHTGGRHVELGYALALGIPVVVVGEPENVFTRSLCLTAQDMEEALEVISQYVKP